MHSATYNHLALAHNQQNSLRSPMIISAYQSAAASPSTPGVLPDDEFLPEFLSVYNEVEHPSIKLLATIHPSSKFCDVALFSDLVGRFPDIAFDGSQYITISQYKAYIHAELLPSRTEASLDAAFARTYQFFKDLGIKCSSKSWIMNAQPHSCGSFSTNMSKCNAPTRPSAPSRLFSGTSSRFWWVRIPISPSISGTVCCPRLK
jgi:hypothetical protein